MRTRGEERKIMESTVKKQDLNTECRGLKRQEKSWKGKQRLITEKHGTIRFSKFYKRDLLIHYKSNGSTDTSPHIWAKKKKRLNKIKLVQQTDTLPPQKQMAGATSTDPQSHIFSSYYGSCSCSYDVIAVLPWALL